jgi:hypothetical protein
MRCFWCNVDPEEAALRFEGPHLTWCPHFRFNPYPPEWPTAPAPSVSYIYIDTSLCRKRKP